MTEKYLTLDLGENLITVAAQLSVFDKPDYNRLVLSFLAASETSICSTIEMKATRKEVLDFAAAIKKIAKFFPE